MTAFLFISPANAGARLGRRVDFANIASVFAETEDPPRAADRSRFARIGLMILILLGVFGDAMLVARPTAVANALGTAHPAQITARASL